MTDKRRYAKRRIAPSGQGADAPSVPHRRVRAGQGDVFGLPLLAWSESRKPARKRLRKLYVPRTLLVLGAFALGPLPCRSLPVNVPAIKRIAAASGAHICARGLAIEIDGRRAANRLAADGQGRPLPWWQGCRKLRAGEIFLLSAGRADSFDGRYFGPSPVRGVIGRAQLLWAPGAGEGP